MLTAEGEFRDGDVFTLPTSKRVREGQASLLIRAFNTLGVVLHNIVATEDAVVAVGYEWPDYIRGRSGKGREGMVLSALGRAEGLLVGHYASCSYCLNRYTLHDIPISEAKLRFAGGRTAGKDAVAGWAIGRWPGLAGADENMIDAVAIAWTLWAKLVEAGGWRNDGTGG